MIVPERQDDVHDVEGLAHVRAHLWGAQSRTPERMNSTSRSSWAGGIRTA